jgi:hypothetical protein
MEKVQMNHLGDTNKMVDTPRTDEAQFGTGRVSVSFARQLERELNAANQRIKRLEEAVDAYRTAYTPDGHVAPHDCFATGPKTGNPIQDLIACPGCWAERKAKEAKL